MTVLVAADAVWVAVPVFADPERVPVAVGALLVVAVACATALEIEPVARWAMVDALEAAEPEPQAPRASAAALAHTPGTMVSRDLIDAVILRGQTGRGNVADR